MSIRTHRLVLPAVTLAVAGTLVAALAVTPAAAATAKAPATTTARPAAAVGWLVQQLVGGTHLSLSYAGTAYPDQGGTADAVFALAASKTGARTIGTVTDWLAANTDAYADISNADGYGPYDGSVAKLALLAEVTGRDASAFGGFNLLKTLQDDECPAASTSCTPGAAANIYSSVSESLAILAEARAGGSYRPSAAAVAYFLSLQCPNGGFTEATTACTSDADASVDETGYALMALQALGGQTTAADNAVTWLLSTRKSAGYWLVQGGPDVDSTGLAAAALAAAGKNVSSSRAWLRSQQVTTGPTVGAGATRGALKYQGKFDAASSPKATADGVLGLVAHGSLATLSAHGATKNTAVLVLRRPTPITKAVKRGGDQRVIGTGFAAGETVRFALHSGSVGTAKANAHGTVRLRFTVPQRTKAVRHVVRLTGLKSGLHATSLPFRVTR